MKKLKGSTKWQKESTRLQAVLKASKLSESIKWNLRCYSHNGRNIAIIQPFKNHLALMFFKGSLLNDKKGLLVGNGPNSQAGRRLEFKSLADVNGLASTIKAFVKEAIELEDAGHKVKFKKVPTAIPVELKKTFGQMPALKKAFSSLTPGRQRGYLLHFSSAKQSPTRMSRIEKCIARILAGRGLTDC